jgi:hypothetical protein
LFQAACLSRHHRRILVGTAVLPLGGGCLRVEINDFGRMSGTCRSAASPRAIVVFPTPPFCPISEIVNMSTGSSESTGTVKADEAMHETA